MLTVLTLYTMTTNFFWMLAEGVFLAVVLVFTFLQSTSRILIICHIIGWGVFRFSLLIKKTLSAC